MEYNIVTDILNHAPRYRVCSRGSTYTYVNYWWNYMRNSRI